MEEIKNSVCFMAFSKGVESKESEPFKRYIGVGSSFVLGVNPNKKELEKMYGRELENDPTYITEKDGVKNVRIDFIVKTDPEKNIIQETGEPIEIISKCSYFLKNEAQYNRDNTKVKVIDKYGRTAWVATEDAKNHIIPQYSNGPANIDKDYRPCYVGEEELIKFLIAYLGIPNVTKFVDGKPCGIVDNPDECEAGLDKIANYFKGDFSELKSIIALQPKNKVKLAYGIRTTDDGKQYQAFFTEMPLKNGVSNYNKLKTAIEDKKANGAYSTTEFDTTELHEYVVNATTFSNTPTTTEAPKVSNNPFESTGDSNLPF